MKRVLTLFALLFTAISLQAQVEPTDTDGNGYRNISTLDHLRWVSENESSWGDNFELDNDINAADTKNWNLGDHDKNTATPDSCMGWSPIGFSGRFDGKNNAIENIYINRPKQNQIGFIGNANAVIINLSITKCDITGFESVGSVVGSFRGIMTNCHSDGMITGINKKIGGFIGKIVYGTISNCISKCNVSGNNGFVGGFVGEHLNSSIKNCGYSGNVTCNEYYYIGGFVGLNHKSKITNSYSLANVNGNRDVGGFAGTNFGSIINSLAIGTVTGINSVGGFVGSNNGFIGKHNSLIMNSSFTGNVTGVVNVGGFAGISYNSVMCNSFANGNVSGVKFIAGFIGSLGENSIISNSFTSSKVIGDSVVGGFVADNYRNGSIGGCFWDIDKSELLISDGATGKTNAELKIKKTFIDAGWNFNFIWNIKTNFPFIEIDTTYRPIDTDGNGFYNIKNLTDLQWLSESGYDLDKDFELDNDINAAQTRHWNRNDNTGFYGFFPIGSNPYCSFNGNLYGNGHHIDSLYINRPNQNCIGFIGSLGNYNGSNKKIKNIEIKNCNITAKSYVGGLVGSNSQVNIYNSFSTGKIKGYKYIGGLVGKHDYACIIASYSECEVIGENENIGGLVGDVSSPSLLFNCYATGKTFGLRAVGGLVGYTNSTFFSNCYSTGSVGLIGENEGSTISGCFWNADNAKRSDGGIKSNTLAMQSKENYTDEGWNFDFIWAIDSGYPYLKIDTTKRPIDTDGDGSLNIKTLTDLRWLSESGFDLDKNWELDNDINAADTKNWNSARNQNPQKDFHGFIPIGQKHIPFTGKFDGNGFIIDSLFINHNKIAGGLFGYINNPKSEIKNLSIHNCDILSNSVTGALVGSQNGTISNINANGIVKGVIVGGLVGENIGGIIKNSNTNVKVNGINIVGGFVGKNYNNATISHCFSKDSVIGTNFVGGFVGENNYYSSITDSYYIGNVIGVDNIGGFVGRNNYRSEIINSYVHGNIIGQNNVGGFAGLNASSIIFNSYAVGNVISEGKIGGFIGDSVNSNIVTIMINDLNNEYVRNVNIYGAENCFWDTETSNQATSAGGTPKTTAQMKTKSTFTNASWNFINIWSIDPKINKGYPYLEPIPVSVLEELVKENNSLSLYPNPIFRGNILNINLTRPILDYTIKIYNMEGILVANSKNQESVLISNNIVFGSYFLVIESSGETIGSEKFIVR